MLGRRMGVLAVLAVSAVLAFSVAAFAEVKDFKDFTVDVPDDWTAAQNGTTVSVTANNKSAAISITVDATDGMSLKDLAAAFAEKLKGSDLKEEDDVYSFTFTNANEVDSKAILNGEEGKYCLIVLTGENPKMSDILDSVKEK